MANKDPKIQEKFPTFLAIRGKRVGVISVSGGKTEIKVVRIVK